MVTSPQFGHDCYLHIPLMGPTPPLAEQKAQASAGRCAERSSLSSYMAVLAKFLSHLSSLLDFGGKWPDFTCWDSPKSGTL
jgi:hypothetical protein